MARMTLIEPSTPGRTDPAAVDPEAWADLRGKTRALGCWTDRAVELANEQAGRKRPGLLTRWRGRRLAARAEALDHLYAQHIADHTSQADQLVAASGGRLRFIPPVAALGTAFVLQVVAMTDIVGGNLAATVAGSDVRQLADHPEIGYLAGMLLGIAVASCAEGGAAYLMDLYDRHLMARDSVGVLRLAMIAYVAASAGVIHWWLDQRNLPTIVSWLLAGMSGSALFLWSRGSRWRHRTAMRSAGQLDPAMPRLPMTAKIPHPIRWLVTLYLVSWEPAATPEEARERYKQWVNNRRASKSADSPDGADKVDDPDGQECPSGPDHGPLAITDAAFLRKSYGDEPPGRNELWRRHGGNRERWTNALRAHADHADQPA